MSWSAIPFDTQFTSAWNWSAVAHVSGYFPAGKQTNSTAVIHVPATLRQVMAEMALASGRSESDLWTEAADAWLTAHCYDDEPLPPAPAAALPIPSKIRCWDTIDDLLAALRRPQRTDRGEHLQRAA